ncbi:MAG TPA: hypothetical protein VHR45_13160 [Thermoanaerobaculia bacterium]|nr:hypothetical protein [Thermoanaerobaculia bacterium]
MRRPDQTQSLARWLAAEQAGRTEEAEAALAQLCAALPRPAPRAGFADAVLARVRIAGATEGYGLFASRWFKAAMALCGASTISLLMGLPAVWRAVSGAWSSAKLIQAAVSSIVELDQWLVAVLSVGAKLMLLGRMLADALAIVPVAALAAACVLVSALAFRFLRGLITGDRRWVYVDPI